MTRLRDGRRSTVASDVRQTVSLASGRMVAFAATFFLPVVLARLYPPAEFGAYKQLFLIFTTLYIIGQFGMAESLFYFLPRAKDRAGRYVVNAVLFLSAAGVASLVLLETAGTPIAEGLNNPDLHRHFTLLGVFVLLTMVTAVLEIVITARGQYGLAAAVYGISDAARAICFGAGALLTGTLEGLLVGGVVFAALRLVATVVYVVRTYGRAVLPDRACFGEQVRYAAPFSLAVLLEYGYRSLHQYLVSTRFDPATFAIYAVGCLQIPVFEALVASAANVLMVRMGEQLNDGDTKAAVETWRDVTQRMAAFMVPAVALLVVLAHDLIVTLFTGAYEASVPIFAVTAIAYLPAALMTDSVLRVYAQTRFLVVLNFIRLFAVALALLALLPVLGLVGAALAMLVASVITKVIALWRLRQLLSVSTRGLLPWRGLAAIVSAAVIAGLVSGMVGAQPHLPAIIRMIVTGVVYVITYGALGLWWGVWSLAALQTSRRLESPSSGPVEPAGAGQPVVAVGEPVDER
ncbi:MAG: hypothetical protein DMD81_05015 [Candidatus Rokuibacteriota bacterium]|nr:MAG: hypothetical protein DMD81_05015 [Candidatus Rokubacteria bacterium]